MNRRDLLKTSLLGAAALVVGPAFAGTQTPAAAGQLAALESRHGGRLGVAILNTGSGRQLNHRGDQRFLLCSTFKLLAVAAVLAKVDQGKEELDRRIVYGKDVLLEYAPVTRQHVGAPGLSVAQLCKAAVTLSDNTAANLLLAILGGPAAVTRFVRSNGDAITRLDRNEPALNHGAPGDERDTTTPMAMLGSMQRLLLGDALSDTARQQLNAWLNETSTGDARIRAGVPAGWVVGDKTGTGPHGETNDVAILRPPNKAPILVTAYFAAASADLAVREAVLAEVGRIAASTG